MWNSLSSTSRSTLSPTSPPIRVDRRGCELSLAPAAGARPVLFASVACACSNRRSSESSRASSASVGKLPGSFSHHIPSPRIERQPLGKAERKRHGTWRRTSPPRRRPFMKAALHSNAAERQRSALVVAMGRIFFSSSRSRLPLASVRSPAARLMPMTRRAIGGVQLFLVGRSVRAAHACSPPERGARTLIQSCGGLRAGRSR